MKLYLNGYQMTVGGPALDLPPYVTDCRQIIGADFQNGELTLAILVPDQGEDQ